MAEQQTYLTEKNYICGKGALTVNHSPMSKFINPFTDVGFKIIFGKEVNKELLIDFLNQLLKGKYEIEDVTFLDKEDKGINVFDKTCTFDIHCITSKGEHIIVEMQNGSQIFFRNRAIYYMSRVVASQGEPGTKWSYGELKAVIGVFLLDFIMKDENNAIPYGDKCDGEPSVTPKFRTDVAFADTDDGHLFSDKMLMVFLQLPAFKITHPDECTNDFERWIYILKNMETLDRMPFRAQKSVFDRLAKVCEVAKMNMEEKRNYDASLIAYLDAKNQLYYFQNGERLAQERGWAAGMEEGMEKGKKEGAEQNAIEIIKNLMAMGMDVESIAKATNKTVEQIKAIKDSK